MSNAGDDESVVLNQLRDAALSGRDPSICLIEYSAEDGCELDDTEGWRHANPGLGLTVSEAAIRTAMPPTRRMSSGLRCCARGSTSWTAPWT